jgi:2-methylcitrate dehydratase PrpD
VTTISFQDFTGVPASTVEEDAVQELWSRLGNVWEMDNLYYKPQAICRWAQPAVEGILKLQAKHCIAAKEVFRIEVRTFHQGICLAGRFSENTEQAQYSIAYPLATVIYTGQLGYRGLGGESLDDEKIRALAARIHVEEDPKYNDCFPQECWARVRVIMYKGSKFESGPVQASWDADNPPSDQELLQKFHSLSQEVVSIDRAGRVEHAVWQCTEHEDVHNLVQSLVPSTERSIQR